MWNEIFVGVGAIATGYFGLHQLGRWSARTSMKQLEQTIKDLEQSKEDHNELIEEAKDTMKQIDNHFKLHFF